MNSDYSNTPIDVVGRGMAGNEQSNRDQSLTKKVVELLENGLNFLNSERVEEALREFKTAESLFNQQQQSQSSQNSYQTNSTQVLSPVNNNQDHNLDKNKQNVSNHRSPENQLDDNYLSVLKYNMACCYQRVGMIDQCIQCLQEAIESLDNKVKSIKEKTNLSFTERSISQPQLSINSQSQESYDQELIIGNLLHKYRYQCKFHLQVCAVLSQMNKHDIAYEYGDKAAHYAMLLMNQAYELCQLFVNEINRKRELMMSKQRRCSAVGSGAQSIDEEDGGIGMGMSPYGVKNQSVNQITNNLSQNSLQQRSIQSQATHVPQQVQVNNYFASSTRNNSVCNRSSESQSSTRVNIRRASSADGSLERIHTFNLKLQKLQNQKQGSNITALLNNCSIGSVGMKNPDDKDEQAINVAKININLQPQSQVSRNEQNQLNPQQKKHFHTTTSVTSNTSNNPAHKVYYVEEKTKVLENIIIKVQPTINEFQRIIKEFTTVCKTKERDRQQMFSGGKKEKQKHAQMKISFHDDTEINLLKYNHKFKLSVRNILGIKHQDDWIFNLNIGNVMHLTPMNTDELAAKLDRTHELNKDAMLEKIILFVVSFFCVGTELRFLSQKENTDVSKKDSEMWHSKALHTACLFLPEECPLVTHIINSYKKHHLNPKLEMQRQKKLEEEQRKKKEAEEQQINSKEQSIGLGGYSTIQGTSKQSTDGNNSRSIGDDHEAMKEIKQQIENFLQKSKKSSTGGSQHSKVNIQRINVAGLNGCFVTQTGQQTARLFSNNNIVVLSKQGNQDGGENIEQRRKSNTNQNSRNQLRQSNTVGQNQVLVTTNSMKNLGQQSIRGNQQQSLNMNILQTLQGSHSNNQLRPLNQSPSNITNDSQGSSSIDQKVSTFLNSKRLTTNFHQKQSQAKIQANYIDLDSQQKFYNQDNRVNNDQLLPQRPEGVQQKRQTAGHSPDNMSINYNIKLLNQQHQQQQFLLQQQFKHQQQISTSQLNSQNQSIVNGQVKSRPMSPRNGLLIGLQNQISASNTNLQQSRNNIQGATNLSQTGTSRRQKNQSPTNLISSNMPQQNQNLQKISSQIIDQILKKTSPLENALKPNIQQTQQFQGGLNLIMGMGQSPTNSQIQGGTFGPGAKKIFVFPSKKKFPLASTQYGSSQQTILIGEQKSPKAMIVEKKLKMSKLSSQNQILSDGRSSLNHSKSQRNIGNGSQKHRGNTPVAQSQKAKNLMLGANQIQMHYQQQKQFEEDIGQIKTKPSRSPSNFELKNGELISLTKYKSLENLPMNEMLNEIVKPQNSRKIKLKPQKSGHGSNLGSNERPNSSKSQYQNMLKNQVLSSIQSQSINPLNTQHLQHPHTQRVNSPINYSIIPQTQTYSSNTAAQTPTPPQMQILSQQQPAQLLTNNNSNNTTINPAPVLNYNFQNINFINNVNIFEENKQKQQQSQYQYQTSGQTPLIQHQQQQISTNGPFIRPQSQIQQQQQHQQFNSNNYFTGPPPNINSDQQVNFNQFINPHSPTTGTSNNFNLLNDMAQQFQTNNNLHNQVNSGEVLSSQMIGAKKNSTHNKISGPRKSQGSQISKYLK